MITRDHFSDVGLLVTLNLRFGVLRDHFSDVGLLVTLNLRFGVLRDHFSDVMVWCVLGVGCDAAVWSTALACCPVRRACPLSRYPRATQEYVWVKMFRLMCCKFFVQVPRSRPTLAQTPKRGRSPAGAAGGPQGLVQQLTALTAQEFDSLNSSVSTCRLLLLVFSLVRSSLF